MTKREKEALQAFVNQLSGYRDMSDDDFKKLQEFSRTAGLSVWCSADMNYKQLMHHYEGNKTMENSITITYKSYIRAKSKEDEISKLMSTLSNLNFWEK